MSYKKIFWGVTLVIIGVLFILNNLGVTHFSFWMIFRLWPLLLIFWGVSLLPIKDTFKIILSVVILALGVIFISTNNYGEYSCNHWRIIRDHRHNSNSDDERVYKHKKREKRKLGKGEQILNEPFTRSIKNAELDFEAVAGSFIIGGKTSELFEFEKDGNLGDYILTTRIKDDKKYIKIELKNSQVEKDNVSNEASIKLNSKPVWDFDFDVGAASLDADLSNYKVNDVEIDGGAAAIKVKLGNRNEITNLSIDAGAASIKIYVPESSACEVRANTFMAGKSFDGFKRIKRGYYKTSNFEDSKDKIYINLDAAVSEISIVRY